MKKQLVSLLIVAFFAGQGLYAQGSPDYTGGYKVKFDEDGKKYFRIISWAQLQAGYNDNVAADASKTTFNLRRARILMFSQISEKFMILTHLGLNSLNADNMHPVGTGDNAQLFFHDVWIQYNLSKDHTVGSGLHYFNGISRLNNQSTLNMLTLDNNRASWSTIGLSDQFARHLGVFAKGKFGKLQYRVSINEALTNGLDSRAPNTMEAVYGGRRELGSRDAGKTFSGYFDFHFLDQESNFLPYKVGSYLGGKKVFNIGAGFFAHPNGSVILDGSQPEGENVSIFAIDAFYDTPIGENGSAFTGYLQYQSNNYGENYLLGPYGTGSMVYAHAGYVLAGDTSKTRWQPYAAYTTSSFDASADNRNTFKLGMNAYFSGHNSKLTLEYQNQKMGASKTGALVLQGMIYL